MSQSAANAGPREAVIIGASLAGLFAAAAAVAAGAQTMIIERDTLPETSLARKGVPQGRQPHVLLHRGLLAAEKLVPGIREDLLNHGAVPFDTGTIAWLGEYGWLPIWIPAYETVSATRPLLEQMVREKVRNLDGVTLREGVRVTDLQHDTHGWWVVCEDGGNVRADVVIDASGRGSRLPHWLAELGVRVPEPLLVDARLGYAMPGVPGQRKVTDRDRRRDPSHPADRPRCARPPRSKTATGSSSLSGTGIGVRPVTRANSINFSLRCPILPSPSWLNSLSRWVTSRSTARPAIGVTVTGDLWTTQLARLAAHGDRGAYLAFARVYHLMAAPAMLFHPSLVFSACRAAVRGMPEQNPRPRALDALMRSRSA